jgi:hypothetical protein
VPKKTASTEQFGEDFFRRFQRHNAQIGASVAIPLWTNPQDEAAAAQSDLEVRRIRLQASALRTKIESESRQAWQKVRDAEAYREIARLDLEVAREQTGIVLAQVEEGRAGTKALEEARIAEQDRWVAYDEAGCELEKARLEVLRRAGRLIASLR